MAETKFFRSFYKKAFKLAMLYNKFELNSDSVVMQIIC